MLGTHVLSRQAIRDDVHGAQAERTDQYTLGQIIGIWALVALPMALLAWVVAPALIPYIPLPAGFTYWLLLIAGMAWQFVVSLVILYRELGTLRWSAIRQRTWLQTPRDPKTGRPNARLFWWVVPAILYSALVNFILTRYLNAPMGWLFPALQPPQYAGLGELASGQFTGQWWILGVALLSNLFNHFLGEEFVFRGVLLPKMQGVFGKHDWLANAVIFALYHLHKPWHIPTVIASALVFSGPARRFHSNWMAVIVHGAEGLTVLVPVLAVILGMVPR